MKNLELFIKAINDKKIVKITFNAKDGGLIKRTCVPFDYGPSQRSKDGQDRYHFYDLDSEKGSHVLSLLPEKIVKLEVTEMHFEPGDYVTWENINWYIKRDWGKYS